MVECYNILLLDYFEAFYKNENGKEIELKKKEAALKKQEKAIESSKAELYT